MVATLSYTFATLLFAAFLGPLAFVTQNLGETDKRDLYLVLGASFEMDELHTLQDVGVREVGPLRAPFATMVYAPPTVHERMLKATYWTVPAGRLAKICGTNSVPAEK